MKLAKLFAISIVALASCASGSVGVTSKAPTPSPTPMLNHQQEINDLAHALLLACYTIKPSKDMNALLKCGNSFIAQAQAGRMAKPTPTATPTPKPHLPVE